MIIVIIVRKTKPKSSQSPRMLRVGSEHLTSRSRVAASVLGTYSQFTRNRVGTRVVEEACM